jgi:hypothetical protein
MEFENWTYDDFLAYLLIYASHADFKVSREEVAKIVSEVGRSEYTRISAIFDKQSDAERAETIAILGARFCTDADCRNKLIDELQELLFADEHYRTEEQAFFFGVKRLLSAGRGNGE